ncbi:MAG: TetR/AcrR family transcriptional regulator [Proteobacteria bacterium]|uniref:TetR/AcrR family transcriptional regulator n=1 Tax=Candidatus Desulfatibia profunda TaxID=2841695 RepID=A0A8J6TN31_9BACT|nr:TetR/AcrR family transcriptional regulator [Candidatus Desulfatibia profunda]MBU0697886.1 TetR/AcrR family transcriptional regulator [Pseudomonadota bacterium]
MRPTNSECKQRILSDVIPIFAKMGYNQVTMREIAAKAGIAPGSLYHHSAYDTPCWIQKASILLRCLKKTSSKG